MLRLADGEEERPIEPSHRGGLSARTRLGSHGGEARASVPLGDISRGQCLRLHMAVGVE